LQITAYGLSAGQEVQSYPLKDMVISCLYANSERLLVGTFNRGLIIYDLPTGQKQTIDKQNGLPDNNVLSISTRLDTIWLSTLSGLSYIAPDNTTRQFPIMETIGSTYIYSVLALPDRILLGTDGKGLYSHQNGTFTDLQANTKLSDATIYQLSGWPGNIVWISTRDEGGFSLDLESSKLKSFPSLQSQEGYAIIKALDEKRAVATGKGLVGLLDVSNVLLTKSEAFDGISTEYIQNTTADAAGNFYFPVDGNIIKFNKPQKAIALPKIMIEKISANGVPAGNQKQGFGPDINQLGFKVGLVWYENIGGLQYRYRLSGFEDEWKVVNADYRLSYPNLSHGNYELEIQPGLNGVFYKRSTVSYRFSIAQHFYLKPWFIIFMVLLLVLLVALIFSARFRSIERKRIAERRILETELANLRTQVNPHFLFNSFNTLLNMIESKPAQAGDYLQRLSDFYRKILSANDEQLIELKEELSNLEEYLYLQEQRFGDALEVRIEIDDQWLRSNLPTLTLQLLAENAIKHNAVSKSKPLKIHIYTEGQSLLFSNNINRKRNAEPGTGTGLRNIKSRYAALFKKEISIVKSDWEFIVKLPLIEK
jgi:hypothetical protein